MSDFITPLNNARACLKNAGAILSRTVSMPDNVDPSDRKLYHLKDRVGINKGLDHRQLEHLYTGKYPEAMKLLSTGNYSNHFFQGTDIDLSDAEGLVNEFNGGNNRILIQSIFDAEVANKKTVIDEFSTVVNLTGTNIHPHDFLIAMAGDMSGTIEGDFDNLADFKNQGDSPQVGQVIDIDVEDGLTVPIGTGTGFPPVVEVTLESPFNAPIMITDMQENSFTVQTIEYNGNEHVLHGTRQFGYEVLPDGSHRFYTRGVAVPDIKLAEIDGGVAEKRLWTTWTGEAENYITDRGGSVVENGRIIEQHSGPTGNEIWDTLPQEQQNLVRDSQVNGLEREIERLDEENPKRTHASRKYENEINDIKDKIGDWETR